MTNAIRKDDRILCGKCLSRLCDVKEIEGKAVLVILCKARRNGLNCNELNIVELCNIIEIKL